MHSFRPVTNLTDFMAEPVAFMQSLSQAGEFSRVRIGPKRFVFTFSPEAAQEILVRKADVYAQNRTVFDRIQPVTGKKGLVQLVGQESQAARLKSRPMFTSAGLAPAAKIIEAYTEELLEKLELSHQNIDPGEAMLALILKTALRIFLGVDSPALVSAIGEKFLRLNYLCGLRMRSLLPPPLFVPTFKNREIRALQTSIRGLIEKELTGNLTGTVPQAYAGDPALIDHCLTFLFAGHETTAASLAFSLLLLAKYPEHQEAIAAGDEELTLAVYKESLRLFPPAYMLAREAVRSDELCGEKISKGDQVIIGISELHRNPRLFDRAADFCPERFLERKAIHPFAFIPFGAGGKSCVGERLAYLEAGIVLRKFCQRFRLSSDAEPIRAEPLITLHLVPGQRIQLSARKGLRYGTA